MDVCEFDISAPMAHTVGPMQSTSPAAMAAEARRAGTSAAPVSEEELWQRIELPSMYKSKSWLIRVIDSSGSPGGGGIIGMGVQFLRAEVARSPFFAAGVCSAYPPIVLPVNTTAHSLWAWSRSGQIRSSSCIAATTSRRSSLRRRTRQNCARVLMRSGSDTCSTVRLCGMRAGCS